MAVDHRKHPTDRTDDVTIEDRRAEERAKGGFHEKRAKGVGIETQ